MEYLVGSLSDFSDEDRKVVTLDGRRIVVVRHRDEMFAISAVCAHMGGPVEEGVVVGKVDGVVDEEGRYLGDRFDESSPYIVCPWHGWQYDLRTGQAGGLPSRALATFATEIRDDKVYLHV